MDGFNAIYYIYVEGSEVKKVKYRVYEGGELVEDAIIKITPAVWSLIKYNELLLIRRLWGTGRLFSIN